MKKTLVIISAFMVLLFNSCIEETPLITPNEIDANTEQIITTESDGPTQEAIKFGCDRTEVSDFFALLDELDRVANCRKASRACTSNQTEYSETFYSEWYSGTLPTVREYCTSIVLPCGSCADQMPSTFSVAEQDLIIAAAEQLAASLDHPCGSKAEIIYDFHGDILLCGPCGTTCSSTGNIIERNAFIYVNISVRCCLHQLSDS